MIVPYTIAEARADTTYQY